MEALTDVGAICAKIRVVLDKGYYVLHLLGPNQSLSNSLDQIASLLSSAEFVIDPRITSLVFRQENYVPGSLSHAQGEEDKIEFLALGLVAHGAEEALDKILNYLAMVNVYAEPYSSVRKNLLATLLSRFQVKVHFFFFFKNSGILVPLLLH